MRAYGSSPRVAVLGLLLVTAANAADAGTVTRKPAGTLPDGKAIEAVTLDNGHGYKATLLSYGATLQMLDVPDKAGKSADVVLGYPGLEGYVKTPNYFGV